MISAITRMVSGNGNGDQNRPRDLDQKPFDVSLLNEISDVVHNPPFSGRPATPLPEPQGLASPLPDYVEHAEGVNQVGRLTAHAMVTQWEETARTIETMGKELIEVAAQTEEMVRGVEEAIEHCNKTAAYYRAKAKEYFDQIQRASMLAAEVTKTCADLSTKIGAE